MKANIRKNLVYLTILTFSVVIIPLCTSNYVSIPMLALLFCSPLLYIKIYRGHLSSLDWSCVLLMLSMALTAFTHPEVFRASTVLYSCLFIALFMTYAKVLNGSGFTIDEFHRLCRKIIIAYAVVIALQQIGLITGTYVINGSYNLGMDGALKVNGFTAEASQTACVIVAVAWGYIRSFELTNNISGRLNIKALWKCDRKLILAFIYVMFGTFSVTCVMAAFLLSLYFIPRRYIIRGSITLVILFIGFLFSDFEVAVRIRTLLPVLLELDARAVYAVDASSSARIGPYILYVQEFDITSFNTWFGYGCDYGGLHAYSTMAEAEIEENMGVGGMINSFYDYGFIMCLAFIALILRLIKLRSFEMFLFIAIYSVNPFSMHTLWIYLIVLLTIDYFKKQTRLSNENIYNNCYLECR